MIVTPDNLLDVYQRLIHAKQLSVDTETTGLRAFHGDYPFSVILSDGKESFYFNFAGLPYSPTGQLPQEIRGQKQCLREILEQPRLWVLHHAKFDMHMLATYGLHLVGEVHCTKTGARLLKNDEIGYSLKDCAARIGEQKSDAVDQYIAEHKLWTWEDIPGKQTRTKKPHFDRVPIDVIVPYAEQDALITYKLGVRQMYDFIQTAADRPDGTPPLAQVLANERALLPAVFHVEQIGIKIDRDYVYRAVNHEDDRRCLAEAKWLDATGVSFQDSPAIFSRCLPASAHLTATGKVSYAADALEALAAAGEPLAQLVLEWRDAKKRLDFYHGFLYHADTQDVIHASFDQAGTVTGRFSTSSPNLQQLSRPEEAEAWPVRRAIVPQPGFTFYELDFAQCEFRLMLDYAGCYVSRSAVIEEVLGGKDVHSATAAIAGIPRSQAKNVNFAIIYSAGLDKLAAMIGTSRQDAARVKAAVMDAAPEIRLFIDAATRKASERGYVVNWFGRRWHLSDSRFAYRAPNFLCQGGGADVMKLAWVRSFFYLRPFQSRIVLNVHDSLLLEVAAGEEAVVGEVKRLMETAYPPRFVPLLVDVSHSARSLADMEDV